MLRGSSFLFVAPWSQLCKGSQQFLSQGLMGGLLVNTSPPPRICLMPATGHWTSGFQTWVCLRIIREAHFKCSICHAEIHYVWVEELTNFNKQLAESDAWVKNSTLGIPGWNLENPEKGAWSQWTQNLFYLSLQSFSPQGQNGQIWNSIPKACVHTLLKKEETCKMTCCSP